MRPGHVGIIGFGAIAQDLIGILDKAPDGPPDRVTLLVRKGRDETARTKAPHVRVTSEIGELIAARPDVIAECAGHGAVADYGASILSHGIDLVVASVGALSDTDLASSLDAAATAGGAQCVVPAGAIGGIDALGAARLSGLKSVTYTGRKPPMAWAGTPAEEVADLSTLTKACTFFEGSARDAARSFPKNANVAATLALAGLGMDDTRVHLIADPSTTENTHEFSVMSEALDFSVRLVGKPSPLNPKTSRSTVYSIARAILNRSAAIAI